MKTDRELLELAAKAAGIDIGPRGNELYPATFEGDGLYKYSGSGFVTFRWRPLADDSDALRLAVKLRITVSWDRFDDCDYATATPRYSHQGFDCAVSDHCDPYAATRRAIVSAAAAIGESMP